MLYFDSPVQEDALKLINTGASDLFPDIIGKGSYGLVLKSIYKNKPVAIKVIDISELNRQLTVGREANALALRHPNIIYVIKISKVKQQAIIIMESFEGVNLQRLIDLALIKPYHCLRILQDIIRALVFCHRNQIVHYDVKPLNVLVGRNLSDVGYVCKLCDFGSSIRADESQSHSYKQWGTGTVRYMSPDALQGHKASGSDDIYSFGVTMWQLLSRRIPYDVLKCNDLVAYNVVKLNMRPDSLNLQQRIAAGTLEIFATNSYKYVTTKINTQRGNFIRTTPPRIPRSPNISNNRQDIRIKSELRPSHSQSHSSKEIRSLKIILEVQVLPKISANGLVADQCQRIFSECWHSDANTRPSADEIYSRLTQVLANYL